MSTFPFQLKSKGCCPDDFTTARGPNKEGCGCYSTPNGCCPDKFTPSPGPDGKVKDENGKLDLHNIPQGCPCNTHEFGCCPNGVSIARGPGQEGCTCKVIFPISLSTKAQDTEFGCCDDRRTPAQGIDDMGCGCAASVYGCCPDGK